MSTNTYDNEEIKKVYEELEGFMKHVRNEKNLIIISNRNTKFGEGNEGNIIEDFGLGVRYERRERLIQFCVKYNIITGNAQFKNHYRRKYV